jgi:hypothetical protein
MSEELIDREEVNALMWNVADLTLVRDIHSLLFMEDDEEEEDEGDS